jgi:uncharacterized protein involved in tellurium resistance
LGQNKAKKRGAWKRKKNVYIYIYIYKGVTAFSNPVAKNKNI